VGTNDDDELSGSDGGDVVCGRGGNDVLRGGDGDDTLDGGDGADTLDGGAGTDDILGGDGADRLSGALGPDVLRGGPANDALDGGAGEDRLFGEDHDDLLDGGPDADVVDGGPGSNRCPPSDDDRLNCSWDEAPASAVFMAVEPRTVDVTERDVPMTLRVHLRDDTGVERVSVQTYDPGPDFDPRWPGATVGDALGPRFGNYVGLVSGTATDGVWEVTDFARRHSAAGTFHVEFHITDVAGRQSTATFLDQIEVVDADPDRQPPTVVAASVRPTSGTGFPIDVRSEAAELLVEARITDDLSGVTQREGDVAPPLACLNYALDGEYRQAGACSELELVAGDTRDGLHRVTMRIPQGSSGGDWNLVLLVNDRAGSALTYRSEWLGPDMYQPYADGRVDDGPWIRPLPDGAGRIPVRSHDASSPPYVTDATVIPAEVDSREADHVVRVLVRAGDPDGDLRLVTGFLHGDGSAGSPTFQRIGSGPVSGDGHNAEWYVDFMVPTGTPPGTYYLQISVQDAAGNTRSYFSPSSPHASNGGVLLLPGPATLTVT
jgi:hypothetical protein